MPNLAPKPVVSVAEALEYKAQLQAIDPSVTYLMSLYLHSSITPDEIRKAKKAGIVLESLSYADDGLGGQVGHDKNGVNAGLADGGGDQLGDGARGVAEVDVHVRRRRQLV